MSEASHELRWQQFQKALQIALGKEDTVWIEDDGLHMMMTPAEAELFHVKQEKADE